MDRIMDSGSIDWSSSLHGITAKEPSQVIGVAFFSEIAFIFKNLVATKNIIYIFACQ
jgi:hypothetical protein